MAELDTQDTNAATSEPSRLKKGIADFFSSPAAATGFTALVIICCLALLAPWISPQNP